MTRCSVAGSLSTSWTMRGVRPTARLLSRGTADLSRNRTCSPEERSPQAHDEPAGPPPAIRTSHEYIQGLVQSGLLRSYTSDLESKAENRTCVRKRRFETVADCRLETPQASLRGTDATFLQNRVRSGSSLDHKTAQTCSASIPESSRSGREGSRYRAR